MPGNLSTGAVCKMNIFIPKKKKKANYQEIIYKNHLTFFSHSSPKIQVWDVHTIFNTDTAALKLKCSDKGDWEGSHKHTHTLSRQQVDGREPEVAAQLLHHCSNSPMEEKKKTLEGEKWPGTLGMVESSSFRCFLNTLERCPFQGKCSRAGWHSTAQKTVKSQLLHMFRIHKTQPSHAAITEPSMQQDKEVVAQQTGSTGGLCYCASFITCICILSLNPTGVWISFLTCEWLCAHLCVSMCVITIG